MSFLTLPQLANGTILDAEQIVGIVNLLAAEVRALIADFAPAGWVGGCEMTYSVDEAHRITASMSPGVAYPMEQGQTLADGTALDIAVRSRQLVQREILLPTTSPDLVIGLRADPIDERLASLIVLDPSAQLIDPGIVMLSHATTDYERVTASEDLRAAPWSELSGIESNVSALNLPATYTTLASLILVAPKPKADQAPSGYGVGYGVGSNLLLRVEADISNTTAQNTQDHPYPECQFMIFDNDLPLLDTSTEHALFGSTRGNGQLVWEGIYTPATVGVHLLELRARAYNVNITGVSFSARAI